MTISHRCMELHNTTHCHVSVAGAAHTTLHKERISMTVHDILLFCVNDFVFHLRFLCLVICRSRKRYALYPLCHYQTSEPLLHHFKASGFGDPPALVPSPPLPLLPLLHPHAPPSILSKRTGV